MRIINLTDMNYFSPFIQRIFLNNVWTMFSTIH